MAATLDGSSLKFDSVRTTGKVIIVPKNSSITFAPQENYPYLIFYSITDSAHALYKIVNNNKVRLLGDSSIDQRITHSGFSITITNDMNWGTPLYIWSV